MDLASMEIFARVVEAKSFSAAARRLNVSKSVVSKHVTRLEQSMGVQLVKRTTRSLSLTEVGRAFYARCADMLAAAKEAELVASLFQSRPHGTLSFCSPVSFGMLHVAPLLSELLASCPDLRVDMTLTNRTVNLMEDGYDVALVMDGALQPGLVARRIASVRWHPCAADPYLRRAGAPASPKELDRHNCLIFTGSGRGGGRRWLFGGSEGPQSVDVDGNLHINNLNALRQAALHGGGIALLPTYLIAQDVVRGDLVTLLNEFPSAETEIHAVFNRSRHLSPNVRAFVDFVIARFGPGVRWEDRTAFTD